LQLNDFKTFLGKGGNEDQIKVETLSVVVIPLSPLFVFMTQQQSVQSRRHVSFGRLSSAKQSSKPPPN